MIFAGDFRVVLSRKQGTDGNVQFYRHHALVFSIGADERQAELLDFEPGNAPEHQCRRRKPRQAVVQVCERSVRTTPAHCLAHEARTTDRASWTVLRAE